MGWLLVSRSTPRACYYCGRTCKAAACPRCELREQAREQGWTNHSASGSNVDRGYGADWQRARAQVLKRNPRCEYCNLMPSTTVDHLIPKYKGGSDDPSNLRACCNDCHVRKSKREAAESRAKPQPIIHTYER